MNEAESQLAAGLKLSVTESGPERPWSVRVTNASQRTLQVGTDPRLLWFSVTVPGRKKPVECRIPADMRPKSVGEDTVLLGPSEYFQFRIDPRFFCFEEGDQSVLVPGAQLEPHFGWPESTRTVWRQGKRLTVRTPQTEPYVAKFAAAPGPQPTTDDAATAGDDSDESGDSIDSDDSDPEASPLGAHEQQAGLKGITGSAIALDSSYIEWSRARLAAEEPDGPKLALEVTRGSDSRTANGAHVTIKITNRGQTTQQLFIRREHLNFLLLGPDGVVSCGAADEERAPDGAAFTTLRPGQSTTLVSRLLEFCATEYLNRPGFFLVAAKVNLEDNGAAAGTKAYTGKLFSTRLRPLRIRSGDLPFSYESLPTLKQARRQLGQLERLRRAPGAPLGTFRKLPGTTPGAAPAPPPAPAQ